ncbi:RNA 2',3'-cyclic phosphodiesterase [Bacteroidota bacterium]
MKRIFIAAKIHVNDKTHNIINEIICKLSNEKIKWVNIANMHITLKFLGDTEEEIIPLIFNKLSDKIENKFPDSSFLLAGMGVFGKLKSPRVLWMGIKNKNALSDINSIVENELYDLGIEKSAKSYSPHLTIGRIKFMKNFRKLNEILEKYENYEFQEIELNEIIIYESILKPTGPAYKALHSVKL